MICDFVNYQFKALTRHGVHSPLIYDLQDNVFLDRNTYPIYREGELILKQLKQDKTLVELTDLGAGSKRPASAKTIAEIANSATQRKKYRELLFRLIKRYRPNTVVELGTSLGVTTNYLHAALNEDASLYTLEGDPAILNYAIQNVLPVSDKLITIEGNFDQTLPKLLNELEQVDFAYIDGNHTYESTLHYFNWLLPHLSTDALLVFDDIYWSEGMKKAWKEIVANPASQYTADLFQLGLVFFTPAKVKQHFVLRY